MREKRRGRVVNMTCQQAKLIAVWAGVSGASTATASGRGRATSDPARRQAEVLDKRWTGRWGQPACEQFSYLKIRTGACRDPVHSRHGFGPAPKSSLRSARADGIVLRLQLHEPPPDYLIRILRCLRGAKLSNELHEARPGHMKSGVAGGPTTPTLRHRAANFLLAAVSPHTLFTATPTCAGHANLYA